MKKINLYMLLIFIAALTGCDDNVNDHSHCHRPTRKNLYKT